MELTLSELEQVINYWRAHRPSVGEECALSPEVNALATLYALMIFHKQMAMPHEMLDPDSKQLMEQWRTHPHQAPG